MARLFALLVVAVAAGSCDPGKLVGVQPLPARFYLDDKYTPEQEEMILSAVENLNETLGAVYGAPVLECLGRRVDSDGFQPEDFDDGAHMLYKIDERTPEYDFVEYCYDGDGGQTIGYHTLADGFIVTYLIFVDDGNGGWLPFWTSDGRMITAEQEFRLVVIHELGHFVSLSHNMTDCLASMWPETNGVESMSISDEQAFCLIHDCRDPPSYDDALLYRECPQPPDAGEPPPVEEMPDGGAP